MKSWAVWLLFAAACGEPAISTAPDRSDEKKRALERTRIPKYYLVGDGGTRTLDSSPIELLPGFGVTIVEQRDFGARRVGRTRRGRTVLMNDLVATRPSDFVGRELIGGNLDFGWAVIEGAPVRGAPHPSSAPVARLPRLSLVTLAKKGGAAGYTRIATLNDDRWIANSDLRTPRRSLRPADVGFSERWLDVDLEQQVLVAYEGDKPRFATLISGGVGKPGFPFATPLGVHRIKAKLLFATMDNIENQGVVPYSYEDVPFTQYIGGVALHGVFWHDGFGHARSHGCINLSIRDAERLFAFTSPQVPVGDKQASGPNGTVIRVR